MAALPAAVAAVRAAVRTALAAAGPPVPAGTILVACSGGADSLALAAATAFVAPRLGLRAGLVTVDHQLQTGSAQRADAVAGWGHEQGFDPVLIETVTVQGRGGPEAAARSARYAALVRAARACHASTVLLGHTRDDQAETVLLALLRGAGPRGLSGMPVRRTVAGIDLLRPLLDTPRELTRAACAALELSTWDDPHNNDPAYARPRARALLDSLVHSLGPGVVANLARTATLLAADAEVLDALADQALATAAGHRALAVADLRDLPAAIRTRVLHRWALTCCGGGSAFGSRHVAALNALVVDWHGQGAVHLPGGATVLRRGDQLHAVSPPATPLPG